MPKLSTTEINAIVGAEESDALDYSGTIAKKRAKLLDYYNAQPFGDEVDGQSQVVTSDVADVVETMLPSLLRIFTQGKNIAVFESDTVEGEQEAEDKTAYTNHVFLRENDGVLILHNMCKDALLQYTGVVKVFFDESEQVTVEKYKGLSELEYRKLMMDEESEVEELEMEEVAFPDGTVAAVYSCEVKRTTTQGRECAVNIPPEEFVVSRSARDFCKPRFIGHRTPKTRSELMEMGFDYDTVYGLPADDDFRQSMGKTARYHDYDGYAESNAGDKSNDVIYLGEYYTYIDVDQDGIAELWQIFRAGETILDMQQVDDHPFCVVVPVPIPHRAIGSCPAEQVADIQYLKSTLVRQALNNVYQNNYQRILVNDRVELDDLLTPRAGGVIRINDEGPVSDSAVPLVVQPMAQEIMGMVEYVDTMRETRSGVTRYNQGLDAESLNKTATGFRGMVDASQQRVELIARIFAETGIREIFRKLAKLAMKYQNTSKQIKVLGRPIEIDPSAWRHNTDCRIDVGLGAGDRQEKIVNLNTIYQIQKEMLQLGLPIADINKTYHTLDKLITEVGLKDGSKYFNDPQRPEEMVNAENAELRNMVQQLQAQIQNPLVEVEQAKSQGRMAELQFRMQSELQQKLLELEQQHREQNQRMLEKLTELELKYQTNVPGSAV